MTPTELQSESGIPIFLKKRDLIDINDIESYLQQLKLRVSKSLNAGEG